MLLISAYLHPSLESIKIGSQKISASKNATINNTKFNLKISETNIINPVVDGNLEEWRSISYYYINDSFDDSMSNTSEIYSLSITFNDTHVFFAYTGYSSEAMVLFIDTDPGAGTGLKDQFNSVSYGYRHVKFTNGFGAE